MTKCANRGITGLNRNNKNKPQEVVAHYRVAASWGFLNITQPQRVATVIVSILRNQDDYNSSFNLTQPVRAVTANLYKRGNKLSCILYNICLIFDHLQWSHIIYCNGSTTFHYIVWCKAVNKTIDVDHSHDSYFTYIIP